MEITTQANARETLTRFLTDHVHGMMDYCHVPIERTGLMSQLNQLPLTLTQFDDLYDTLFYSKLISKALRMNDSLRSVIDLGAGSSIPTLLALKEQPTNHIKAIAVDIDPDAIAISKRNAETLGLAERYSFYQAPIHKALADLEINATTLVVSNPPYIPVPTRSKEHFLLPVDGGGDGADYIMDILNQDYAAETTLALLWGSLTNPMRVIPLIQEKYDVIHVDALRIHFGNYTNLPEIKEYLYQLKGEDKIVFDVDAEGGESQIVLGTILKRKILH